MPGVSTILDNLNVVSHKTRELIFERQIVQILQQERLLQNLARNQSARPRTLPIRQEPPAFGMGGTAASPSAGVLQEPPETKLKQLCRRLLRQGKQAQAALKIEFDALEEAVQLDTLAPSRRELIKRIIEQIGTDLSDAERVIGYASDRVFHGKKISSTEKVLSLSDGAAAFITKGNRSPVIGYKPQLVRSQNGFITSLIVPEGNAADSGQLIPAISDSIKRTGVIATLVSTDDGYSSAKGRDALRSIGVKIVSFSGAKGKKLTSPEDCESEPYREARRYRSAVESLMFTIKDGFDFGELGRRGIEAVRDEQLEKVLAYNCCRSILIEKRRREELEKAA